MQTPLSQVFNNNYSLRYNTFNHFDGAPRRQWARGPPIHPSLVNSLPHSWEDVFITVLGLALNPALPPSSVKTLHPGMSSKLSHHTRVAILTRELYIHAAPQLCTLRCLCLSLNLYLCLYRSAKMYEWIELYAYESRCMHV